MATNKTFKIIIFILILALLPLSFKLDNFFLQLVPLLRLSCLSQLFMFIGSSFGLLIFVAVINLLFLLEKKEKHLPYLIAAILLAIGLSYLLKHSFARPRPEIMPLLIKSSFSFPSTHAAVAASTLFFVSLLNRTNKIIACILITITALSGYYNGIHYLSDVAGGMALGMVISYLIMEKCPAWVKRIRQK
ncbi:MAG: phosphatase PAP2 family protein [Nanoarchaeota archaeon]